MTTRLPDNFTIHFTKIWIRVFLCLNEGTPYTGPSTQKRPETGLVVMGGDSLSRGREFEVQL